MKAKKEYNKLALKLFKRLKNIDFDEIICQKKINRICYKNWIFNGINDNLKCFRIIYITNYNNELEIKANKINLRKIRNKLKKYIKEKEKIKEYNIRNKELKELKIKIEEDFPENSLDILNSIKNKKNIRRFFKNIIKI